MQWNRLVRRAKKKTKRRLCLLSGVFFFFFVFLLVCDVGDEGEESGEGQGKEEGDLSSPLSDFSRFASAFLLSGLSVQQEGGKSISPAPPPREVYGPLSKIFLSSIFSPLLSWVFPLLFSSPAFRLGLSFSLSFLSPEGGACIHRSAVRVCCFACNNKRRP